MVGPGQADLLAYVTDRSGRIGLLWLESSLTGYFYSLAKDLRYTAVNHVNREHATL